MLSHKDGLVALHALQFASALHNFLLADGLNEDAVEGAEALENRERGPRKRKNVASKTIEIVANICNNYWTNTASITD